MTQRRVTERGSALMLVPAGVLVLLALGAISVDSAIAFSAQRELDNAATAAANDAATVALTQSSLQNGSTLTIDMQRATEVVHQRLDGQQSGGLVVQPADVAVQLGDDGRSITVKVAGDAPYIFSKAIPGATHVAHVEAVAAAELAVRTPQ